MTDSAYDAVPPQSTAVPAEQPASPIRVCKCGASLNGRGPRARFCSNRCEWGFYNLRRSLRKRAVAALIKRECGYCRASLSGRRSNVKYCSRKHKSLARYIRGDNERSRVDPCNEPGCTNRLAVGHATDYCKDHQRGHRKKIRKPRQVCAACGKELRLGNKTGYCPEHKQLYWQNNPEARKRWSEKTSKSLKESWANDPERHEKTSAWSKKFNAEREEKLKAAWRPDDWWEKPMEWRIIGNEFLSRQGYMTNEELGQRLDEARMFKCPYGETWQDALSGPKHGSKRAINLVSEIRTWVKRDRASCDENAA